MVKFSGTNRLHLVPDGNEAVAKRGRTGPVFLPDKLMPPEVLIDVGAQGRDKTDRQV